MVSDIKGRATKLIARRTKRLFKRSTEHASEQLVDKVDNAYLVRNHIVGWMLAVAGLIFLAGLQYVWYQGMYSGQAFTEGGVYAEATLGKINTLNPLYASTNSEKVASRLIFSSLFDYDTTGHLKGDLAKSLKISEDGKTYSVAIKEGVQWHDGKAVTLDDVLFTVNTIKDSRSRALLHAGWEEIAVAKKDNHIEFTLPAAFPGFTDSLTFAVLPEHILGKVAPGQIHEAKFSTSPVGSGPFKFQLSQTVGNAGQIIHLVKNDTYHAGAAKLDRIQLHTASSRDEIARALKNGEVNATADLTSVYRDQLPDGSIYLHEASINKGVYAFLNLNNSVLKDTAVRQALQQGVDMNKVRSALGADVPALSTPILPSQINIDMPAPIATNRDEAIKKLEATGLSRDKNKFVGEDGKPLRLKLVTVDGDNYQKIATALATEIEQLGIGVDKVIFNTTDPNKDFLQEVLQPRNYDILVYEIGLGADPDVFAYWHSSQISGGGFNLSNYSSPLVDDLLSSARTTQDPALRRAKYKSFVDKWQKDVPALGIYQVQMQYFYNKNVRTFGEDVRLVSPLDRFSDVQYWASNKTEVYKTP